MKFYRYILISGVATFNVVLIFEITKEWVFQQRLTAWQSHWLTILFCTIVSMLISYFFAAHIRKVSMKKSDLREREARIASINEVMHSVNHHVNNLANSMQLIELENQTNNVSEETLRQLRLSINMTTKQMLKLSNIRDPYDKEPFKIEYPDILTANNREREQTTNMNDGCNYENNT